MGKRFTVINFLQGQGTKCPECQHLSRGKNIHPFAKFSPHLCLFLTLRVVSTYSLCFPSAPRPSVSFLTCNSRTEIPEQANE